MNRLTDERRRQLTAQTVVEWVHLTNELEFESPETESDTKALLAASLEGAPSTTVVQRCSVSSSSCAATTGARDSREKVYPSMFGSYSRGFRPSCQMTRPACVPLVPARTRLTMFTHTTRRCAPVPAALEALCRFVHRLERGICQFGARNRLLYVFALAAFAQFHFVDIHPFRDGNGRLGRFISKRILDAVCSFPTLFSDRDMYIDALVKGRQCSAVCAPVLLLRLLLETAVSKYQRLLQLDGAAIIVCAPTVQRVFEDVEICGLPTEDRDKVAAAFAALAVCQVVKVHVACATVLMKRTVDWSEFDELVNSI